MHPPYRGVAFLLSLGTLPIACGDDKTPANTTDTGNGPNPASEGEESTVGAGTTAANPTTGPVGTTSASTTGTDLSTGTEPQATTFLTNNPQTSEGGETFEPIPDFPPPMNPVCQAYADHIVECYPRYRPYAGYFGYGCDYSIMYGMRLDGPACADALEAMYACFNAVPCDELMGPDPCEAEQEATEAACPSSQEPPPDDTDSATGGETEGESG